MFSRVLAHYEEDKEFINEFVDFMEDESNACDLAQLGEEGLKKKHAEAEAAQQQEMQQEMMSLQKEQMKIRSLHMIMKMSGEEQSKMIKESMAQMRQILIQKPEMKEKVKASLLQRGIPVEHVNDPVSESCFFLCCGFFFDLISLSMMPFSHLSCLPACLPASLFRFTLFSEIGNLYFSSLSPSLSSCLFFTSIFISTCYSNFLIKKD